MRRKYCIYGLLLAAFGLGLLSGCLIASGFLQVLLGVGALALGLIIFFS